MEFLGEHPWLLAVAIFLARILDVSIGTMRTIMVLRGYRYWAASMGFVEILIWLLAVSQIFQNLDAWYLYIAYAAGFAFGNVVGISLEARLAVGEELVRVVSESAEVDLAAELRNRGFSVTEFQAEGDGGVAVEVLLIVARRRRIRALLDAVRTLDPGAYWTLSEIRTPPSPARRWNRSAQRRIARAGKRK